MLRAFFAVALSVFSLSQDTVEPALRAAVEQFFATQQAEDADAYLALWSATAKKPQLMSLKYIFESGDDTFQDLQIVRAVVTGDTARVWLTVTRARAQPNTQNPAAAPRVFNSTLRMALSYVREGGAWKLLREGSPEDELANALVAEPDAAARLRLLESEKELVTLRLVDAIGRIADDVAQKLEYRRALSLYEVALQVARVVGSRKSEGQMLQNVANSLYFLQRFPESLAAYEGRLALERDVQNDDGIASALVGIATIKYSTFAYSEALQVYRDALEIQERIGDQSAVSTTLISIGNVLYLQGDYDAAIAEYTRAEALKRQYFDLAGAAVALESLGRTYAAQGNYAGALVAFNAVIADSAKRRDARRHASALQAAADVHVRLLNLDAARASYGESRRLYETVTDLARAGRSLQGTGLVELLSARLPQAAAAYESSLTACNAAKPEPDGACVAQGLVGLGFAQASQELWDAAIASYQKGIQAFLALRAVEGAARAQVGLAEAFLGKEEYVRALAEATTARTTGVAVESDDLLWRALVSQSRAQRRLKRPADALGSAKAAVLAVRRMAAAATERPAFAPPRDTAAAFAAAAVLHAEGGDAAAAWNAVEEMRALTLRSALAANEREIATGMTDEERSVERAAAAEIHPLIAQRERERNLPRPDAARLKKLDAAILSTTGKRNAAQKNLFARRPELAIWRGLAPAATSDDVMKMLADGDLLLQFVVDDHDLLLLTARRAEGVVTLGAHLVPVKRQQLAESVARTLEPTMLGDGERWKEAAAELVNKVVPATVIDHLTSARRIVIMPDDMLWRLPFEALPIGSQYLADIADVRYAASATSLVREPAMAAPPRPFGVAIVAAPQLGDGVVETIKTTAPLWALRAAESAAAEAQALLGAIDADADLITGGAATVEAFRAAATAAPTLHVTGPFRLNAASPLFSPMLLAGQDVFETRHAPTADLAVRTLVISDPAALSMRDAAAALPPFRWAWRAGGVETVVLRRWESNDAAAREMLTAFYAALHAGRTAAEAIREARSAVRSANPALPPAVWAGWIVLSSWRP